jgi:hypothetical protein
MQPRPKITPSGWWFAVAGLAALVGLLAGVAVIVRGATRYADRVEGFERAVMPTTLEVEISDPGGYSIYHENDEITSDGVHITPEVEVTDPSGNDVFLRSYGSDVTYDVSGHSGVGVYTFRAEEAGRYAVDASMPFESGSDDLIAVGPGVGEDLAVSIVAGIALIGVGIVGGIVIAIVVGVMRGRSRRTQMPAPVVAYGPPGPWGAPAWPPGPPSGPGLGSPWAYPPAPPPPPSAAPAPAAPVGEAEPEDGPGRGAPPEDAPTSDRT